MAATYSSNKAPHNKAVYVRSTKGSHIPVAYIRLKLILKIFWPYIQRYMNVTHNNVYTIYKALYEIK